ncbi:MAG: sugar metabolism cluster protein [Planctomycetes bacterium]|nr:sugar metabolism cluster protein [Planctomycetota bacterium]
MARYVLGTKAESLSRLKPLLRTGCIEQPVVFTHAQWKQGRDRILTRLEDAFSAETVIVRSSARNEDSWIHSQAGVHKSVPNVPVDSRDILTHAIDEVIASYDHADLANQILVQTMLSDVTLSGVVMTRSPASGAPYYVIDYDMATTRTDSVTSGNGDCLRTLVVQRRTTLNTGLPAELYRLMNVVTELEDLIQHDSLDIEFAFTNDGRAHVLQVRPMTNCSDTQAASDEAISVHVHHAIDLFRNLQSPRGNLLGRRTLLSVMCDWNPAEMIGTTPNRLAFSLYRYLITSDTWAKQRAEYGYRDVRPRELLVDIAGHPYVDVRTSFNSFVPASLPDDLAGRLVDYYLDRLTRNPHLHDSVEFNVLFTCLTFDFDARSRELRGAGFGKADIALLRNALIEITRGALQRTRNDLAALAATRRRFSDLGHERLPPLQRALALLEDARLGAVLHFAHLARTAFVAVSMLRSLCAIGRTTDDQTEWFLGSVFTVSQKLRSDAHSVAEGRLSWSAFVDAYGHLRPGSYDITSPHYAAVPEEYLRPIVENATEPQRCPSSSAALWDQRTRSGIVRELERIGLTTSIDDFGRFLREAIEGRELGKYTFTRNLSAALEALAEFGERHSVSREDIAHVDIRDLIALRHVDQTTAVTTLRRLVSDGEEASEVTQAVLLPDYIASEGDFQCFEPSRPAPSFVTRSKARAAVVVLSPKTRPDIDLRGKIALTPSADPGFDWIFSRNIEGLITMYGGTNSHMAIRANEYRLPAAIGVGQTCYHRVEKAQWVEMDCKSRQIRIVH